MKSYRRWLSAAVAGLVIFFGATQQLVADDSPATSEEAMEVEHDDAMERHLRHESLVQIRAFPTGLSLLSDFAVRQPLFDSENALLDGTYLDAGVTTGFSPAYAWGGPYIEILPVAVLNLRASAQVKNYFGTFGYLFVPDSDGLEGGDPDWGDDALDRAADESLGQSALGWRMELRATPQALVGPIVITGETSVHRMGMEFDDPYYEPYFDLLFAPEDTLFLTRPTVGYLHMFGEGAADGFLIVGARWERAVVREMEITRDTVGLVWNWQVPESMMEWGTPTFAGFGGVFVDHPTRGSVSPYLGMQFMFDF